MTVAPVVAQAATGQAGDAGLITALFSGSTVCAELLMPSLLGRFAPAPLFGAALALIGVGSLGHLVGGARLLSVAGLAVVRGLGFGTAVVSASVLVAELAPASARGRAIGNLGLVIGIASLVSPAAGLLLLGALGPDAVFGIAGVLVVLGALAVRGDSRRADHRPGSASERPVQAYRGLAQPGLLVPFIGLALVTTTYGGLVSFAPLALGPAGGQGSSAAAFFLVYGAARAVMRWLGGRGSDRFGYRRVLLPGLACMVGGLWLLPMSVDEPLAVLVSALLYGAGSGMAQSASFVGMLLHAKAADVRLVSTLWNMAFDAGVSVGGAVLGFVAAGSGAAGVLRVLPILGLGSLALFTFGWRR